MNNDTSAPKSRQRRALTAAALVAGFALFLGATLLAVFVRAAEYPSELIPEGGGTFTVNAGETGASIADRLAREGFIRSSLVFEVLQRVRNQQASLKRGTYRIAPGMGTADILDLIVSGRQDLIRVTIPEGFTLRQTAEALAVTGAVDRESFMRAARDPALMADLGIPAESAEGYLFPDTYHLPAGTPGHEAVRIMVYAFRARLSAGLPESRDLDPETLHRKIILASIVEREYRVAEEAPRIAGVFSNRLRIGMALQSCATVVYVITEVLGREHPEILFYRDIEIRHRFNTYVYPGLPPGPIANPGITAITAAFRPEPTRYLYFRLLDRNTGRHYFSTTLDQHIRAGSLAIKAVGGR
ncbi:MAG TPA: endolytic transglycosylase MltG [Magnetospirillaceae bacterium]|nr:endolytic transglycosylase MltG [Magnetospirillaceae bacterium]